MGRNWYEWLKNQIRDRKFDKPVDCASMNGQLNFAYIADLITKEQRDELSDMIPKF